MIGVLVLPGGQWVAGQLPSIPSRINDLVENELHRGLALPLGTTDILEFSSDESSKLITLMFLTTIFAWSVGGDLYVIPNDGRCIMKVHHHDVIHVWFRSSADCDLWVSKMEAYGFPLPDTIPDPILDTPDWMNKNNG